MRQVQTLLLVLQAPQVHVAQMKAALAVEEQLQAQRFWVPSLLMLKELEW